MPNESGSGLDPAVEFYIAAYKLLSDPARWIDGKQEVGGKVINVRAVSADGTVLERGDKPGAERFSLLGALQHVLGKKNLSSGDLRTRVLNEAGAKCPVLPDAATSVVKHDTYAPTREEALRVLEALITEKGGVVPGAEAAGPSGVPSSVASPAEGDAPPAEVPAETRDHEARIAELEAEVAQLKATVAELLAARERAAVASASTLPESTM